MVTGWATTGPILDAPPGKRTHRPGLKDEMTRKSVEMVVTALEGANVRYLIAGGLAVVAHGYVRFTADLDLIIDPDSSARLRAIRALAELGYEPRVPVPPDDFANSERRAEWIRAENMLVFSLRSPDHAWTAVDLFLEPPFDFEEMFSRKLRLEISPGVSATVIGYDDLVEMKRRANRPVDLTDLAILEERRNDGQSTND
jgi:hypothetical protein